MRFWSAIAGMLLGANACWGQASEVERLGYLVEQQRHEIEELRSELARIERILGIDGARPVEPVSYTPPTPPQPVVQAATTAQTPQATPIVAGFRFSGDLRFRFDAAVRSASASAGGLQNIRERYRFRFNADRDIGTDLNFHAQLSTGAVNNGITFDQDFAGGVTRHPFFISEAWVDYHPQPAVSFRGGRVEEIFADRSRFVFDDDVRFNGFNERWKIGRAELRAGQYVLVHPNTFSVPADSPFTLAGVAPGKIARDSMMFHQGIIYELPGNANWKQQFTTDVQLYRNPNLIALTSNPGGVTVTINPAIGLTLSSPATGVGNALRSPTSAILFAPHFQIVRAAYRVDSNGLGGNPKLPVTWMLQTARNVGTSQLRDAMLTSISVGRTTESGDVRALYAFSIKDANSLISQFTDDDLGTALGVNIATHHIRMDYTLRRNISLENLLFLQKERRSSNPAASFFVPLGRQAPLTWRYQGQLAISF